MLIFILEMGFVVLEASLEFLTPNDLLALASQSAGITDVSHHAWPAHVLRPWTCKCDLNWEKKISANIIKKLEMRSSHITQVDFVSYNQYPYERD